MNFAPVRKLAVWRTFSDGRQVRVGGLAQNRQGVFFQYDADYLTQFSLGPALETLSLSAAAPLPRVLQNRVL